MGWGGYGGGVGLGGAGWGGTTYTCSVRFAPEKLFGSDDEAEHFHVEEVLRCTMRTGSVHLSTKRCRCRDCIRTS